MKQAIFTIKSNVPLTKTVFRAVLVGNTSEIKNSGQFVNLLIDGFFLRRPISVCDKDRESFTIVYKVVGKGTEKLSKMQKGEKLDILTGLGNGYDESLSGETPLLIGGGVGVPPLYLLCKNLIAQGKKPTVILGFNTKEEIFLKDEFESLGVKTLVATADGSFGIKGFVTDALKHVDDYSHFFTCGPEPMLKAVFGATETDGQFSFEERMGCGFGACMGCSCKTVTGYKRICKEGPVLRKGEILW
ncbi:MAG: dihydroorotate dehydrogenase electron transfer subunit [Clostridiales bacterium]|nr:dihydroorotate dehydrogenase electron transfer subunit [Clostridiales bacterium]MDY5725874.1 dihydroorotate dehydrogenase electron transfer subunit [Eubacteriales bacterium]